VAIWGKVLKIEFDRIGFTDSDIGAQQNDAAKGYRVDRNATSVGKGQCTRDKVEWMIPPLWPWKEILTCQPRGRARRLKAKRKGYRSADGRY